MCAELLLVLEDLTRQLFGDGLEPGDRILSGRRPQQRGLLELGIRSDEQRALVGEVAERSGAGDFRPIGGPFDRRRHPLRQELARRIDESFASARFLLCSAGQLIWD